MAGEIRIRERGRSFEEVAYLMKLTPMGVYMQQRRFKNREKDSKGHKIKLSTILLYRLLAYLPDEYVALFTNDANFKDRGMYLKEDDRTL
jgi:hypothetical protein